MASEMMPMDIVKEKASPVPSISSLFDDLPTPARVKRNSSASSGALDNGSRAMDCLRDECAVSSNDEAMQKDKALVEECKDEAMPKAEAAGIAGEAKPEQARAEVPKEEVPKEAAPVAEEALCIKCGIHPTNQRKALHQKGLCCNNCPNHGPWCTMHKENKSCKKPDMKKKQSEKKSARDDEVPAEQKPKRHRRTTESTLVDLALRKAEQAYNEKIDTERKEQKKRRVEEEREMATIEKRFKKRHTTLLSAVSATSDKVCGKHLRLLAKSTHSMASSSNETADIRSMEASAANCDEATSHAEDVDKSVQEPFSEGVDISAAEMQAADVHIPGTPDGKSAGDPLEDGVKSTAADEPAPLLRTLRTGGRRSSVHEVLQQLEKEETPEALDTEDGSFMKQVECWLLQEEQEGQVAEAAAAEPVEQSAPAEAEESPQENNSINEAISSAPFEEQPQADQSGKGEAALNKVKLLYKKLVEWKQCSKEKSGADTSDTRCEALFDKTLVANTAAVSSDSPDTLDFAAIPELI